jgi:putative chitinase
MKSLFAIFLVGMVLTASAGNIQQNLDNLKSMMANAQAANQAALANLRGKANNNSNQPPKQQTQPQQQPAQTQPVQQPAAQQPAQTKPAQSTVTPPKSGSGKSLFTLAQLQEIMPNSGEKAAYYLQSLNDAMSAGGLTNCPRVAAFLAQIGHESGSLIYTTEIADGSGYEGITDIGNTSPGDGVRYKGRGLIQVTGKYNYQIVGDALGYNFVADPERLATVPYCVTSAVWWWNNHSLSTIADGNTQESFDQTTRIINGGYNGKADRDSRWAVAKRVLGC